MPMATSVSISLNVNCESQASIQRHLWHRTGLLAFLSHEITFYNVFLLSLTVKPGPGCQIPCLLALKHSLLIQWHPNQIDAFQGFFQCQNLAMMEFTLHLSNTTLTVLPASESKLLYLKACTTMKISKFFFNSFSKLETTLWVLALWLPYTIF